MSSFSSPTGPNIRVNCSCGSVDPACVNIPIGTDDIQFRQEGKACLPVVRTAPVPDANCKFSGFFLGEMPFLFIASIPGRENI